MDNNLLTESIIGCAIDVHKQLGPGLLESVYENCLMYELKQKGFSVENQVAVPLVYKEIHLDCGYRLDLLVNNTVIIEIKSIDSLLPVHTSQVLTYMRFAEKKIGLLMNFNVKRFMDGFHRYVL
ncbi:MAG: GxxExxY protein [Ignavibacteriota bacterium]|nr:GxxExxY protein [Ignavibacteriota bacterium]